MTDVSGIGGADFSVAKGAFPPDENGRLNRPAREDARPEDSNASPVRSNEAQADQRSTQPSQTTNDGTAQQNAANTGDFTAGGTDRRDDTVFISPEAQNAARAEANATPAVAAPQGGPAVAEAQEGSGGTAIGRDPVARTPNADRGGLSRLPLRRPVQRQPIRRQRPTRPNRPRPMRRTRAFATRIRMQRSAAANPTSQSRAAPSARSSTSSPRHTDPSVRDRRPAGETTLSKPLSLHGRGIAYGVYVAL